MRREERGTVQGPVKKQPDGMSHRGGGAISFFSFGAETFPAHFFGASWGTSCFLGILRGGGSQGLLRSCRQSVHLLCKWLLSSSLMSWCYSNFGPAKVSHNRLSTRNQRLGLSKFPVSHGPAPQLEVCSNFPPRNCPQRNPPPPTPCGGMGRWLLRVFEAPPTPIQWLDNPPPHPRVEDSLLKRRTHAYTRKHRPVYSLSLRAPPPPPPPP